MPAAPAQAVCKQRGVSMNRCMRLAALAALATGLATSQARAALVTDSSSFNAFSVTYDSAVWGAIKFAYEADAFTGAPPVDQFGFGQFFLDPGFKASSNGADGPPQFSISGQIVINAKPGWGLYNVNFTQSGQWTTLGSGVASVAGSVVDILANGSFFYDDQRTFTDVLTTLPNGDSGYYYIIRERSSLSRFGEMTIDYDIELTATALDPNSLAQLASDASDPSFLGGQGPYPASNIVGTYINVSFERIARVPEPSALALLGCGWLAMAVLGLGRRATRPQAN
jgi:hypothetical protein